MPFWKGDQPGRPVELGRAIGARLRALARHGRRDGRGDAARRRAGRLGRRQPAGLPATSSARRPGTCPTTARCVVERFRDELGDWRLAVHCVLGARVNGAWALAIGRRLTERYGVDAQVLPADDGIVVRLPDTADDAARRRPGRLRPGRDRPARRGVGRHLGACSPPGSASAPPGRCCCPAATRAAGSRCGSSASAPRSCSTWPASTPTSRSPWRRPGSACRTSSTCPALVGLMRDLAARKVRLVEVETPRPSPFARSLLFGYVGAFLYEGDAPLAERRAAALALDSDPARRAARPGRPARAARPGGGRRDRAAAAAG